MLRLGFEQSFLEGGVFVEGEGHLIEIGRDVVRERADHRVC